MDLEIISNLESKIGRAIEMIADLKEETSSQKKENETLKRQLDRCQREFKEYKENVRSEKSKAVVSRAAQDGRKIKERLEKLAGKLAALEDSWS
jgi:FtsZ-binding cell division protein ZapB